MWFPDHWQGEEGKLIESEEIICEEPEHESHENTVEAVRGKMPDDDVLIDLAELFKIFGDSTRVRILYALLESELCVCDIAELLGMTPSAISHQLRILRHNKLVTTRRVGKHTFCRLADDHVKTIIGQGMSHILE